MGTSLVSRMVGCREGWTVEEEREKGEMDGYVDGFSMFCCSMVEVGEGLCEV